ncbi:MAG TPA: pilus assembly protein TadG-related protein [Hyphomicrobiales bacterium]|nr:pilus assembly protein TadG-related protein [Hyphomicrobiales bacterium]
MCTSVQPRLQFAPRNSPWRTRGSFSVIATALLPAIVLFSVLALDSGRLYWEGQDLQRLADLAALDVAYASPVLFNGIPESDYDATQLPANQRMHAIAVSSATINGMPDDWTVSTTQGTVDVSSGIRTFKPINGAGTYGAVEVAVTRELCASVIANLGKLLHSSAYQSATDNCLTPTTKTMTRRAVANPILYASFSAGTTLLTADFNSSPLLKGLLNDMLGLDIAGQGLSLVGFRGLTNLNLSMLELQENLPLVGIDLNAGTVDELLKAPITIGDLAQVTLNALDGEAVLTTAIKDVLQAMVLSTRLNEKVLNLGEILDVYVPAASGSEHAVMATKIAVDQLLNTAILIANQDRAIEVPNLSAGIGNLVSATASLGIIQPPQIKVGPVGCLGGTVPASIEPGCQHWRTEARTAQISLDSKLKLNLGALLKLDVDLKLSGVNGRAGISSVKRLPSSAGHSTYAVSAGGYTGLTSSLPDENQLTITINLLPGLDLSFLQNLLASLPIVGALLGNETLLSVISNDVKIHSPLAIGSNAGGKTLTWPTENLITVGGITNTASTLNGLLNNNTYVRLDTKVRRCTVILFCTIENKQVNVTLGSVLPGAANIIDVLTSTLDSTLNPLLEALGMDINPMEIRIIDINAGSAELVI